MSRRLRGLMFFGALVSVLGVGAVTAWADGLPVPPSATTNVIAAPDGSVRYVTQRKGQTTRVTREAGDSNRVLDSMRVFGAFTIPVVALDGTASGLAADGNTLVLIRPRKQFPQKETTLATIDAQTLRLRDLVTLRGDFSFDAISPDGGSLYLINYTSPRDPTEYDVRAYDTDAGRLLNRPIVDPSERGEQMRGYPMARVVSPNGRWAYTLYDGGGKTPFIHALDTTGRTAHCVDLKGLRPAKLDLRQSADGGTLTVTDHGAPTRVVDTGTFEVTTVGEEPPSTAPIDNPGADGGPDWALLAAVALVAAGAAWLMLRRRRRLASP